MSVDGFRTTLSVQTLRGGWADVMQFHGGSEQSQLERAVDAANSLAAINGMPVRITLDWPEEES